MKIAVTGASGSVGRELVHRLRENGHAVVPLVRRGAGMPGEIPTGPLEEADIAALAAGLRSVDAVAHLAARTHVHDERGAALDAYRRVNVTGTEHLLRAVATAGVPRFVYMSSVKVNGEETRAGRCFSGNDAPAPEDAYGRTKLEAERLVAAAAGTGLQTMILRPPMVYGAGIGGNFGRLVTAIRRGIPLPFARIDNRRSLISVRNLADATALALLRPNLNGLALTVGDGEDVSTRELVEAIGAAIGRPARLVPMPVALLRAGGGLVGRGAEVRRLTGNLQVDTEVARTILGWTPGEQLAPALRRMLTENEKVPA